jgi:hypothetical protein
MGGEHRTNVEGKHRAFYFPGITVAQRSHGPSRGAGLRFGVVHHAIRARATDAVNLLCRVDQQKEQRESARRDRGALEREPVDIGQKRFERRCCGFTVTPRATRLAQRLDGLKSRFSFEPTNDTTERGGEPPDVVVQWYVLRAHDRLGDYHRSTSV